MHIPLRRLGVYCVAFLFAIVMNFAVPRLMPGSPVDGMIAQLGPRATPAAIEAIKARFGAVEQPMLAAVRRLYLRARHLRSRRSR